jgi:hypothetical protein
MREVFLPDLPDSRTRSKKAVWRQVTETLRVALVDALGRLQVDGVRVGVLAVDSSHARALDHTLPWRVTAFEPGRTPQRTAESPAKSVDAVAVCLSGAEDQPFRMTQLEWAMSVLQPAGRLLVLATVVRTGRSDDSPPSMSQLMGELQRASGTSLQIDDLAALRWANEPLHRGVLVTATSLAVPEGAR